ncbi:uncharacterized protein LOC114742330 [Neltuma alba]|uniref:uncharacterized protein LOC114742330 n=1 Tax=Neltuma alba TaxID=207710 RepID=UPI0010A33F00|nr:uncharacterized protein LOC114742330 [Prosopis alba]
MTHYSSLPAILLLFVTRNRIDHTLCLWTRMPIVLCLQILRRMQTKTLTLIVLQLNSLMISYFGLLAILMDLNRLSWPPSTRLFDISPERVFQTAAEKLEGVGAKIPRSCLYLHVPMESSDLKQSLHSKGFNGSRPSVWIMQGFPIMTLANFEDVLSMVSSLAMKGCLFVGELPGWLAETGTGTKAEFSTWQWMDRLFMSNGFRVELISDEEIAENAGKEFAPRRSTNMLFVAEQLRFSDDQMETWRREFQRVEDEGDEEGFEEL